MSYEIIKECKRHGKTVYRKSGKKNIQYRCVKCRVDYVDKNRKKTKKLLIEYKGGKCEICGYNKCDRALQFHHRNPEEKDFGLSTRGLTKSLEELKREVDKCALLCGNCHMEVHDGITLLS